MQSSTNNNDFLCYGLVLATGDCTLFLSIDMEVQWRMTVVCGCLIQVVASYIVFDSMTPVAAWCNSFTLLSHTTHYYTLYLTTEERGRKWAVLQHRRCIGYLYCFYLIASGLFHFLYYSILLSTYLIN